MGLSLRGIRRKITDVFDANTASDQKKRLAAGQPRMYQQQHPNAPAKQMPVPRMIARPNTQIGSGRDARNIFSKLYDQVDMFDNGRTFKNDTPTNTRSRLGQATHNGLTNAVGGIVKPIVANPVQSGIELGRFGAAQATHNNKARNTSLERIKKNYDESLMGYGANIVKNVGGGLGDFGAATTADFMNKPEIANIARDEGIRKFNSTPFGQVTNMGQKHVVNIGTRLNNNLNEKSTQNLVDQRLGSINIDPKASLGKQVTDTASSALQLYGLAEGVRQGGQKINAIAKGKGPTVVAPEVTLPKVTEKGAVRPTEVLPPEQLGTVTPGQPGISSTKSTPMNPIDRIAAAKEYVKQQNALQKAAAKSQEKGSLSKAKLKVKTALVDSLAPLEDPVNKALGYGADKTVRLREQINRSLTASKIASSFAKQNGLEDIIKSVGSKKNRAEFDQYVIAKHAQDLEANGVKTGRDLAADANLVDALKSKYELQSQRLTGYNHTLLDEATNSGLISAETNAFLKEKYPNYVPFERIFSKDELQNMHQGTGAGTASLSKHQIEQRIKGSDRQIASPLESIATHTDTIISQGERNKAFNQLVQTRKDIGQPFVALRTAESVVARREALSKLKELKLEREALSKEVSNMNKSFRELEKRNTVLGKGVLDKIMGDESQIRNNGMREANGGKLQGSGSRLAKLPDEAQIQEAFQQYLDGNPRLVQNMFEFGGNKAEQTRIINTLDGVKNQLDSVMGQRKEALSEVRLNADAKARGNDTISGFNNGIKEVYEVTPDVAKAAKNLSPIQQGAWGKVFSYPTRVLRLGATGANVSFALANVAKDAASGFINSEHPMAAIGHPKVFLQALDSAFHHGGENFKELQSAGVTGTSYDLGRNSAKLSVEKMASKRDVGSSVLYTVSHPSELLRAVEDTIGRSEELGRAYQYFSNKEGALAKNKGEAFARTYAADAARSNTVNFNRFGEYGRVINTAIPYINAGVQGARVLTRNIKERPLQTGTKIALVGLMPTATTTAWNLSDPERKKAYDSILEYEKENNIIIVPPNPKQDPVTGRWNVIKIPVSQEIANLNNIVRNGIIARAEDASFNFKQMAADLIGTATSAQVGSKREALNQVTPQIVKSPVEGVANQNLFTGQQIVPDAMKNLSPKDQFNKGTSGTARTIGRLTNTSPLQIDNIIKTNTGGLGQNIVNASDTALNKLGVIPKDQIRGKSIVTSTANRFNSAQGTTEGGTYYKSIQDQTKRLKLVGNDYEALQQHLTKSIDKDGKPIKATEKDALARNQNLYSHPNVVAVLTAAAKEFAKKEGKPLDPIYELSPEKQREYYRVKSSSYNGQDSNRAKLDNKSWLPDFQTKRRDFYKKLKLDPPDDSRIKYPLNDSKQKMVDQYFAIDDPAERGRALSANPEIGKSLAAISKYGNDVREAQGFKALDTYPETAPIVKSWSDEYFKQPKGSKMKWQKANPEKWQAVSQDLASKSIYTLQEEAAKSQFKDTGMSQKELKSVYSLGQYNINKTTDANGNTFYSLGDSSGSGGGYGGGGGGKSKGPGSADKYAISVDAGGKAKLSSSTSVKYSGKAKVAAKSGGSKPKVTLKKSKV